MVGGVIVTHGDLGKALLNVVSKIIGKKVSLPVITIEWREGASGIEEKMDEIKEAIEKEERGKGVIVFTDIFGGTPTNMCVSLLENENVEIITGVNLPLLLKFISEREKKGLEDLSKSLTLRGKESIGRIRELLEK
ncbi:MAG: hypothetical protein J7L62_04670 [Candidatus Aminicenantes bacterium]|nr:hypothetical protein [Candidatus Aminicenantes bacterium]